jgi:two-component system phosphate regulon sensor histidine kinase PhoR
MPSEVIEAIPMPALLVAANGRISETNPPARRLFGEAIRDRHYITVLRQPTLLDAVEQAFAVKERTQAQYLTTEARRDTMLLATCVPLPGGSVFILLEDRTAMEEAFQMRRDFVANVSHELKTPLTALMGFIETLRGAAKDDTAARERFLAIMEREAGRMNRLVSDLLSLSRVEADERVRPLKPVDLSGVVRSVAGTLAPLAAERGTTLTLDLPEGVSAIPGDADQLAQVVTNLVENAIKYSRKDTKVTVSLHADTQNAKIRGDAVVLTVEDQGEGIDPIHIPRLTERFYRIDSHRSREMGGTGLGLAIVKHIVNRHRGRLSIESAPGQGSRFSVILPVSTETR